MLTRVAAAVQLIVRVRCCGNVASTRVVRKGRNFNRTVERLCIVVIHVWECARCSVVIIFGTRAVCDGLVPDQGIELSAGAAVN